MTYFHESSDWRTRAACADDDPNDWVWINSHSGRDRRRAEKLKAICATCPVRQPCLDTELAAMRNGDTSYGVFGGYDAIERRQLLGMSTHARQLHRPSTPMTHGTVAGYVKHVRYPNVFGPPCTECRNANNRRQNDSKKARRARIATGVADWVQRDHPMAEGGAA